MPPDATGDGGLTPDDGPPEPPGEESPPEPPGDETVPEPEPAVLEKPGENEESEGFDDLEEELEPWPERKPLPPTETTVAEEPQEETGEARALATADLQAVAVAAELAGETGAAVPAFTPQSQAPAGLEPRIQEIGATLHRATQERGPAKTVSSFIGGRAMQRRILAQTMADPAFKTQLFRFVDVYPSIRDSGDLLRHLRDYLGGLDAPRPLDRLVATDRRRLPGWAVTRLTERGIQRMAETLIAGRDATDALPTLKRLRRRHTSFTLDLLGEACLSDAEAEEYALRYHDLLDYLPAKVARWDDERLLDESPYGPDPRVNISLKVSSLYSLIDPLDFEG